MRSNNILLGCIFAMLAEVNFVGMGSLVKLLSESLPSQNILFFRNLFGLLLLFPLIYKLGFNTLKTDNLKWHLLRSLSGVSAMYCFFYALSNLPLADAMVLKISSPLFIPIIAFIWLSEHISLRAIMAIMLGFLGVILVLKPTGAIHIASLIVSLCISTIPMFWYWQNPSHTEWLLLVLLGACGTIGQLFLTKAYVLAPASRVAPFTYSSILFAAIVGWIFWGETVTLITLTGALMIISAGIIILREKKVKQEPESTLTEPVP